MDNNAQESENYLISRNLKLPEVMTPDAALGWMLSVSLKL